MCFDAKTSISSFIISSIGTGMLFFSGDNTKKKFAYFWVCIALIQLWEYFIWINIDNKKANMFWTIILRTNIALQPLIMLLVLNSIPSFLPKQILLTILIIEIIVVPTWLHIIFKQRKELTLVNKNNNLSWPRINPENYNYIHLLQSTIYFLALTILPWFIKPLKMGMKIGIIIVSSILLSILKTKNYNIIKDSGWTSIWCYTSSIMPIIQYYLT